MAKNDKLAKREQQLGEVAHSLEEVALQQKSTINNLTAALQDQNKDLIDVKKERDATVRLLDALLNDEADARITPEAVAIRKLCSLGFQRRGWLAPSAAKALREAYDAHMEVGKIMSFSIGAAVERFRAAGKRAGGERKATKKNVKKAVR